MFCLFLYPFLKAVLFALNDFFLYTLTFPVPCISENCIKIKVKCFFRLHKTFWGSTKKCGNKNLTQFFLFVWDWDGKCYFIPLRVSFFIYVLPVKCTKTYIYVISLIKTCSRDIAMNNQRLIPFLTSIYITNCCHKLF